MSRSMTDVYVARCLCGLRIALHRDDQNRTVSCAEAARRHPHATVRERSLRQLLESSRFAGRRS